MNMYADILSSAVDGWVDDVSGAALVDYTLSCRAEMLRVAPQGGETAYSTLATVIAYDRALIKLCEANHVDVRATRFAHAQEERTGLEHELVAAGIDLMGLAAERAQIA